MTRKSALDPVHAEYKQIARRAHRGVDYWGPPSALSRRVRKLYLIRGRRRSVKVSYRLAAGVQIARVRYLATLLPLVRL